MAIKFSIKNKKGIFFSLIAILTISLFVLAYKTTSTQATVNKVPVVEDRIRSANMFLSNMHDVYVVELMEVSLKNAFYGYHDYLIANEEFDSDQDEMQENIISLMENGDVGSDSYNDNNLDKLLKDVKDNAKEHLRMNLTYSYSDIEVYQNKSTGPWFIGVRAKFNLSLDADAANWSSEKEYETFIHIKDLPDPFHSLNTINGNNYVERNIKPVAFDEWNPDNFKEFILNGEYTHNNESPSYFQRLVNDTGSSTCCGIETFITENDLYHRGGELDGYLNTSFSDICYFKNDRTGKCQYLHAVEGISTDYDQTPTNDYPFRIGAAERALYNLTEVSKVAYD